MNTKRQQTSSPNISSKSALPDFDKDFVDETHIQAFAQALAVEEDSSLPQTPLLLPGDISAPPTSSNTTVEYISSKNDWSPVYDILKAPQNETSSTSTSISTSTKTSACKDSIFRNRQRNKNQEQDRKKQLKLARRILKKDHSREGITYQILRWPFLMFSLFWIAILTVTYTLVRIYVSLFENLITWRGERHKLRMALRHATTYEDWITAAMALDELFGNEKWKQNPRYFYYDYRTVGKLIKLLQDLRANDKIEELSVVLQGCLKSNFAGTESNELYSQTYYGTKHLLESYNEEVVKSLEYLTSSAKISADDKQRVYSFFFKNFGTTALCLSGGACFAYTHFGILKALLENDLLPKIITGTSGGGLIAALACTRTNEELKKLLVPELADKITACWESFPGWFFRWYRTGARFDAVDWARRSCWFTLGSLTFQEAYERTGKILNISTVPADPNSPVILCNHITSPNCVIWSSLLASSAVPGILNPVVLMMKTKEGNVVPFSFGNKWRDGSLRTDIPVMSLNQYFNVKFSVVSQVNPHISLFYYAPKGTVGRPVTHRKGKGWRGGFLGSFSENFLKLELRKWLKLMGTLELFPRFLDQDWSRIWLQRFSGTVTLWPKIKFKDFWYILSDPTPERLKQMILNGERTTFPKLLFIRHRLNIERAIMTMSANSTESESNFMNSRLKNQENSFDDNDNPNTEDELFNYSDKTYEINNVFTDFEDTSDDSDTTNESS